MRYHRTILPISGFMHRIASASQQNGDEFHSPLFDCMHEWRPSILLRISVSQFSSHDHTILTISSRLRSAPLAKAALNKLGDSVPKLAQLVNMSVLLFGTNDHTQGRTARESSWTVPLVSVTSWMPKIDVDVLDHFDWPCLHYRRGTQRVQLQYSVGKHYEDKFVDRSFALSFSWIQCVNLW